MFYIKTFKKFKVWNYFLFLIDCDTRNFKMYTINSFVWVPRRVWLIIISSLWQEDKQKRWIPPVNTSLESCLNTRYLLTYPTCGNQRQSKKNLKIWSNYHPSSPEIRNQISLQVILFEVLFNTSLLIHRWDGFRCIYLSGVVVAGDTFPLPATSASMLTNDYGFIWPWS